MYQRILVPIDGSPIAEAGLDEALQLGRLTGATLRLLHVIDLVPYTTDYGFGPCYAGDAIPLIRETGEKLLQAARAKATQAGLTAETQLQDAFSGRVSDQILDQARSWHADLIVIGTHGRRGISRLALGSDAEQVLREATVPVLLIRGARPAR